MIRTIGVSARLLSLLGIAILTAAQAQAPAAKDAEQTFKMQCASGSARFLPKGNAAVGEVKFALEVDPAAQRVSMDGDRKKANIDKFEISFRTSEGSILSISRPRKTFRVVIPIKDAGEDSRQYLMYEGSCKTL